MSYVFKVNLVNPLPNARVTVLDGEILSGTLKADANAYLKRDVVPAAVRIKGVLLGAGTSKQNNQLSITVDLQEASNALIVSGDILTGA